MEINIDYRPNEKQDRFHRTLATYAVYGGAKGGGKTKALIMDALAYALENPGANIYLFRETYPNLEANLIREWFDSVPKELYTYKDGKHIAKLYNGSSIMFRYVKSEKDAASYQGQEMDYIGIDELTKHTKRTIQLLQSCLRSAKGFPVYFRGTCNPGGRGHAWVKHDYVEATNYGEHMVIDEVTKQKKVFVPAKVYDNVVLMHNDPTYAKRLEALPEMERKAFLMGDWDVFIGQVFSEFSREKHVIKPFEIPKDWTHGVSMDWGFSKPFSIHWYAIDYDGTIYVYREYYGCTGEPDVGVKMTPKEVAEEVKRVTKADEMLTHNVADKAIWQHDERMSWAMKGESIADIFSSYGINFMPSNSDRLQGKMQVHEYLRQGKLKIFDTCKNLIRTLPELTYDDMKPEDVDTTEEDHAYDELRYFLMSRPIAADRPRAIKKAVDDWETDIDDAPSAWSV